MTGTLRHLVAIVLLCGPGIAAASEAGGFLENPRTAFARARQTERPLLLKFHTTWCTACERMQRTTWRDPRVVELLGAFVPLSVNGERNRNLQSRYSVDAYPTIVIADSTGRVLLALLGFQDASAMAGHLDAVLHDRERLEAWAARAENGRPDPEAWLGLADFARGRQAFGQAEALYRRTLGRKRALTPEVRTRAQAGLFQVLAETDRCREALRLVRDGATGSERVRAHCSPP